MFVQGSTTERITNVCARKYHREDYQCLCKEAPQRGLPMFVQGSTTERITNVCARKHHREHYQCIIFPLSHYITKSEVRSFGDIGGNMTHLLPWRLVVQSDIISSVCDFIFTG